MGQSLSVGATLVNGPLSKVPLYPTQALGLNFGRAAFNNTGWRSKPVDPSTFVGFTPLSEPTIETPMSGMIDAMISDYAARSLTAPTFLSINTGEGGKTILQLSTSKDHVFQDTVAGLAAVPDGDTFAVDLHNGTYDFYVKNGQAAVYDGNQAGPLVYWDNLVSELNLAVGYARTQGYQVSNTLVFDWIQGQSGTGAIAPGQTYGLLLGKVFDKITAVAQQVIDPAATVIGAVAQTRSWNATPAIDQLNFVQSHPNVTLGAPEYWLQAEYQDAPGAVGGATHLKPEGYYIYGQTIGHQLFGLLQGQKHAPLTIDNVTQISPTSVLVHFAGVDTSLVSDPSVFRASNGMLPPPNLGFYAYRGDGLAPAGFAVSNATIISADTVEVDFSSAMTGQFRLYLGRSEWDLSSAQKGGQRWFGGSTLRDAATIAALPANGATLSDPNIYNYAPTQFATVTIVPNAPVNLADTSAINGFVNAARNTASQTITGIAESRATVSLFDNGAPIGTAFANASGAWAYRPGVLGNGAHSITATSTTAPGNTGPASAPLSFVVDSLIPVAPSVTNAGLLAGLLTLTGVAEAGAKVTVLEGANIVGTTTADATGAWNYATTIADSAVHRYTEKASDAAGNVSAASGFTVFSAVGAKGLPGNSGADVLIGAPGDTLSGYAGNDTFVFHAGFGKETINDFTPATATAPGDILLIDQSLFPDWDHLIAVTSQQGANLTITLDPGDIITLRNVALANFTSAAVHFA